MGEDEGRYAAGVIKRLGIEDEEVPCVLIGSLFATGHPALVEPYMASVRKVAPKAYPVIPTVKPVQGAVWLAVDALASR